jgi:hypothetical protein
LFGVADGRVKVTNNIMFLCLVGDDHSVFEVSQR